MSSERWGPAVRCGVPGVLVGLALAWGLGVPEAPRALAQPQGLPALPGPGGPAGSQVAGQAGGTIAIASGVPGSTQWLYLINTQAQAFAVYRINPQEPRATVKLEATRRYAFDLKLDEYNNLEPRVEAVQRMVAPGNAREK